MLVMTDASYAVKYMVAINTQFRQDFNSINI